MFQRHFSLLCFLLLVVGLPHANASNQKLFLPPPTWQCIQTFGNDVVLNWTQVADPFGNFVQYEVHSLEDGLIAVIPSIATTSYTHLGVSSIKNYFITVIDNVSGPSSSLVIQNLRLNLVNPSNGIAFLSWNNTNYPNLPAPARPIQVLREYPIGTWTIQDSVTSTTTLFRDTIDICDAFLNYQLSFPGDGCPFTSNVLGDQFEDKITPNIPVITNVSIDTLTGLVNLNWNVNQQPDTYAYIIYLKDAAGNVVEIDTVWGINNTTYAYLENTTTGPLTYSVAAFDSCLTTSATPSYQTSAKADVHTSIFLQGYYDPCGSLGVLNWTPYLGWSSVSHYDLYLKNNGAGTWQLIHSANILQYSHIFIASGLYDVVIKANHTDGRFSFSNKITLNVNTKAAPSVNYILSASVINQEVFIRHLVDTSGNVSAVAFERQRKDGSFYEIGRKSVFLPITSFTDVSANVEEINVYRAVIIDSCGLQTTISDTVHTVLLSVISDTLNYINTVSWTPYIGYDGSVMGYDLYRMIDGIVEPTPIASLGPGDFTYLDPVDNQNVRNRLCYFVVALESMNTYGFAELANSNVRCTQYSPTVFVPNAFTPGGPNPLFKPVYSYMAFPKFEMYIFNRWGEEIFQTDDPFEGWNGFSFRTSTEAVQDVYIYKIRFYGIDDKELTKEGHVTLIR